MGERSGAPRASALHQSSFRNLRLQFNYRSQMSQLTVTHPSAKQRSHRCRPQRGVEFFRRFHPSTAEGVVPRLADALRQPHRSLQDPIRPSPRSRFDLLATSSVNDRYLRIAAVHCVVFALMQMRAARVGSMNRCIGARTNIIRMRFADDADKLADRVWGREGSPLSPDFFLFCPFRVVGLACVPSLSGGITLDCRMNLAPVQGEHAHGYGARWPVNQRR